MYNKINISVFILSIFLLTACPPDAESDIKLGEKFSLNFNGSASIEPDALSVQFTKVIADSRCPEDVECVWGGKVEINLLLDKATVVKMSLTDEEHTIEYRGFQLILFNVLPYPNTSKPTEENDYSVELMVKEK